MKFAIAAGLAIVLAGTAFGQSAKPSPYTGVSHPPDEAIVTNDLGPTTAPATSSPDSDALTVSPPTAHMETMPKSPGDHDYIEHSGLVSRPAPSPLSDDGDADIVTSVPSGPNQLPEGTTLTVSLDQQLSTATTQPGAIFSAHVVQPVMKNKSHCYSGRLDRHWPRHICQFRPAHHWRGFHSSASRRSRSAQWHALFPAR